MNAPELQSEAFQLAALRSERVRIIGLLGVLAALVLTIAVRALFMAEAELLLESMLLLAVMGAYEALMLVAVKKAIRAGRDLGSRVWVVNVVIESLFPTTGLLLLTASSYAGPYVALVAPAILIYFFFIVLSTLRLRPTLSVLTGVCSCLGYLSVTGFTYLQYPTPELTAGIFSLPAYFTYAFLLLMGGLIAATVTHQIRVHVGATIREVKLRSQVEQMEHDLEIARSIQQGLLPSKPPALRGYAIAGWNLPADQTGGDYFDWQELPDGRYAISLADVTGHGIGPALVAAVCRAYSRASFPADDDTTAVVDRINRLLVDDLPPQRFVTFAVAILDAATSTLQLLSAGHGPILHFQSATGEILDFEAQGIPLGLMAGVPYGQPENLSLAPGDMLVVTTDGFFEWENPEGEEFGIDRMKEVIQKWRGLDPEQVIQQLESAVTSFARGTEQADDLTAIVLKRMST